MSGLASVAAGAEHLPELRQDLSLVAPDADSRCVDHWLIYDPVRHRYCEVDRTTFEVLSLWREGITPAQLIDGVERETGTRIDPEDVAALVQFAAREFLLAEPHKGGWRQISDNAKRSRKGAGAWLVHNYLFFKIPLFSPQLFLAATMDIAKALVSGVALRIYVVLAMSGLYLVSREWDEFMAAFAGFMSLEGMLAFGIAIVVVKTLHELGHAYTAVAMGCRVPAIGIAFMVLTPMLYTDVTDAWRIGSRRKRLMIDGAGVGVELMLAAVATFIWPFLPPGTLKTIVLAIATTSWIMSLAINLNPFMRFDGYYILSDLVGVQNLQSRSFALARWWIREALFALDEPPPEIMAPRKRAWLIFYAMGTWLYRLALFIGIALLVYHYFFKALGIVLFIVEIVFFIALPVWSEIMEWSKRAARIVASGRSYVSIGVATLLFGLAVYPWSGRVDVPTVIEAARMTRIYPPRAARIVEIAAKPGADVVEGDVLVVLRSEQIEQELRIVEDEIGATRVRLARGVADMADREQSVVRERELRTLLERRKGLIAVRDELTIRSPISGRVVEMAPAMHAGRMIGVKDQMLAVADPTRAEGRGYVAESDVARLTPGAHGRFIFEDGRISHIEVTVTAIGVGGIGSLDIADLSSLHGGPIESSENSRREIVPAIAQYPVQLAVNDNASIPRQRVRGMAVIAGQEESFATRVWKRVMRVLVREAGF